MVFGSTLLSNWLYKASEGTATVYLNFEKSVNEFVKGTIAFALQDFTQTPQSMHLSSSIIAFLFLILTASTGHILMQDIPPVHFDGSK